MGSGLKVVGAATLLGTVGMIGALIWFKGHGLSAAARPSAMETYVARHLRALAIPSSSAHMHNPVPPDPEGLSAGADDFVQRCVVCHSMDGSGKTEIGTRLYPPCPDLREQPTQAMSDGALFYVIKNGIRFTGMPAWKLSDDHIWHLVTIVRRLPQLSVSEMDRMARESAMSGRHRHSDSSGQPSPAVPVKH